MNKKYKQYGKGLNLRQFHFCEWYCMTNNKYKAAKMAGYETRILETANRLLANKKVIECIKKLKQTILKLDLGIVKEDIINKYIDIAFSDMGNYIEVDKDGKINLLESKDRDYTVIKKATKKDGAIELEDKMKALQWLSDYMMIDPTLLHKHNIDSKKIEIEQEKLKLQKNESDNKVSSEKLIENFVKVIKPDEE